MRVPASCSVACAHAPVALIVDLIANGRHSLRTVYVQNLHTRNDMIVAQCGGHTSSESIGLVTMSIGVNWCA